jgi:spore coat polysaccharide biosynthesis protein SpsF
MTELYNNSSKKGIVIQARLGSSRFPGKVLALIHGKSVIEWCYERCRESTGIDTVVVAVPVGDNDLIRFLNEREIPCFLGHETNLISRIHDCAIENSLSTIVRITADNPLIDPVIIDRLLEMHLREHADYTSTRKWNGISFEGLYPKGMSVDIFNFVMLSQMNNECALTEEECEHLVFYFGYRKDRMKVLEIAPSQQGSLSLSIDTPEDYRKVELVMSYFDELDVKPSYESIVSHEESIRIMLNNYGIKV